MSSISRMLHIRNCDDTHQVRWYCKRIGSNQCNLWTRQPLRSKVLAAAAMKWSGTLVPTLPLFIHALLGEILGIVLTWRQWQNCQRQTQLCARKCCNTRRLNLAFVSESVPRGCGDIRQFGCDHHTELHLSRTITYIDISKCKLAIGKLAINCLLPFNMSRV